MENEKNSQTKQSTQPHGHHSDALATKLVNLQGKKPHITEKKKDKPPAGGHDETPIPKAPPGFTLKFTFHRAASLPMADINSLSSDPYILAQLNTDLPTRHKQDPHMRFRTPTIRRSTDPVWNCEWIIANVPASGFALKARIYDEDPADHDDRLGNVHVHVDEIGEGWVGIKEQEFRIKKRMGSKRAYLIRGCASMLSSNVQLSGTLVMSVELLGRTEGDHGGRVWTVGPCAWSQHFSPMIGRLAGTKDPGKDGAAEKYNFQANQFQLEGPVPSSLYHRYVEFKPFVAGMFNSKSLRGRILNRALHHQHSRVYNYDRDTVYGSFPSPSFEMTLKFLELVHYDHGGRIYTYVITLDGQWRFTETGKEFGIDLLSKHTMHSDVNIYIAFSGEFFIRRLKNANKPPLEQETHPPAEIEGGPPHADPPTDPAYYSLVIDNDSGTYRPNAKLLPDLKRFMQHNLAGLKIVTLDSQGDAERMAKMKTEQRERKKREGTHKAYMQNDSDSMSSSDEEELDRRAAEIAEGKEGNQKEKKGLKGWIEGDREREKRETEDDMAIRPGPSG